MAFGLPITIEHAKGSTRTGVGPDGKEWSRRMHADYGHIRRTEGTDGDELDVYVGPDSKSDVVFVISQLKAPEFKKFDEQKFMLGFPTAAEAKACYLKHYPNPKILGGMTAMTLDDFKAKAMTKTNHGKKLASHERLYVEMNLHLMERGEKVSAHVMGGPQAAGMAAQFAAERGVASPFVADLGGGADFTQYPRPHGGGLAIRSRTGSGAVFKTSSAQVAGRPLTVADRSKIKEKNFAIPESRKYPIHDISHARAALSMVAKHGTPEEQSRVRAAVAKKWPGISSAPAKEKRAGDRTTKIEDTLDNVGLGILAAPYVAGGLNKHLSHRPGVLGAIGRSAGAVEHYIHDKIPNRAEIAGLALVAPGIIKPMAKGINKMLPGEKPKTASLDDLSPAQLAGLEKVASRYVPDYEYLTEAEKVAWLGQLMNTGARAAGKVVGAGQALAARTGQAMQNARTAFGEARSAAQHASKIRGIQQARDFRVGVNRGAGTAAQAPRNSIVSSVNDRAQRIAEQRQALAQFRQSKGLGTSAERAAANRGAVAQAKAPAATPQPAVQAPAAAAPATTPSNVAPAAQPNNLRGPATQVNQAASAPAAPAAPAQANVRTPAPAPARTSATSNAAPDQLANTSARQPGSAQYGRDGAAANPSTGQVPAAPAGGQTAFSKGDARQIPGAETGILDSLHSYLPQGTPRWAVPAALGVGGGLAAGALLSGRNKENAISLESKTAALKVASNYARPAQGFLSKVFRGAKANAAPAMSAAVPAANYARPNQGIVSRLVHGGNGPNLVSEGRAALNNARPTAQPFNTIARPGARPSTPAPTSAGANGAAAAQKATKGSGSMISGKTIAKGALIGTLGLGLYGGKKVIDVGADLATGHRHIRSAPTPDYSSVVL